MSPVLLSRDGPYAPQTAGLGGVPTTTLDDPITAVFLFLFVLGAASHMTILQLNLKRSHKFIASGALFGFCMARITACVLRLVWSTHTTNISVVIAANVFLNAGVIIIIIINLIFAQRIVRAMHPTVGWSRAVHFAFVAYFVSIPCMLVVLITGLVQSSFTLNPTILAHDRTILLIGGVYNSVAAFMPIPIIIGALIARHVQSSKSPIQEFGSGRFRTKVLVVLGSATLICLGASFRAGIAFVPRPSNNPAWYHSKAAFYCFNFVIEIIVIYSYAIVRVDRRFFVPNGSSAVRHYRGSEEGAAAKEADVEAARNASTAVETEEEFIADFKSDAQLEKADAEAQSVPART